MVGEGEGRQTSHVLSSSEDARVWENRLWLIVNTLIVRAPILFLPVFVCGGRVVMMGHTPV